MLPKDIYMSFDKGCLYHKEMMEIENENIKCLVMDIIHGSFLRKIPESNHATAVVLGEKFYITFDSVENRPTFNTISTSRWTIRVVENLYPGQLHGLYADDPYTLYLDNGSITDVEKSFVLLKLNLRSFIDQATSP